MSNYTYMVTNKINGKVYVGSHSWDKEGIDPNYYGSGTAITRAVKKYGKENFQVEVLYYYNTIEECRADEERILTEYDVKNCPHSYNLKNSAIGFTSKDVKGRILSEEHKQKISQANKGKNNSQYGKRGKDSPNYGKHHTAESRKKMSEAQKGEKHPLYGKHLSEETRKKISQAHKGKTVSEETRKKISQAFKGEKHPLYGKRGKDSPRYGKHHTEDAKRKMSESKKGENNPNYGKHPTHTEETRKKLSEANNYRKTPIVAIDKNGKVKIFESKRECARQLNLNRGNIYNCLRGRCKTCKGYTFKYVEELESGIYEGITEGIAE